MSRSPRCYVCTDKDCRREDGYRELLSDLRAVTKVKEVDCQDLCEGPVAGVVLDGRVEWFEKLRKERFRQAVVALARDEHGEVPRVLKARWASKRSGKVKR